MFRTLLKRTHRAVGTGIAGAIGHSMMKYRRFGRRNAARNRVSARFRKKTYQYSRRKRISRHRKRALAYKKKNIRKARKRGAWTNFTARRTNQVSLEFDMNASQGGDKPLHYMADVLWYGNSKGIKATQDKFRHHWMKSISFKFDNFKVRTLMRTVTTEGTPPQEYTTEQVIEPSFINMRYRWDKWGDKTSPGHMVGHDDRIEEVMQNKCIKNCKDKFWGIWKPKGATALMSGPKDGDAGFGEYVKRMKCRNFDENGPPHLRFWFCPESTLPDQFFKPDPPVVRTAKIFVDFDSTFYTKWFCSEKRISYS